MTALFSLLKLSSYRNVIIPSHCVSILLSSRTCCRPVVLENDNHCCKLATGRSRGDVTLWNLPLPHRTQRHLCEAAMRISRSLWKHPNSSSENIGEWLFTGPFFLLSLLPGSQQPICPIKYTLAALTHMQNNQTDAPPLWHEPSSFYL